MTRLAVHSLGADRLVVSGDDGRRWVLGVPPVRLGDAEVQDALGTLRSQGADVVAPPPDEAGARLACLRDLPVFAAAVTAPTTVRWTFAGCIHRMMLRPGRADAAREVVDLLLATVADADEAAALSDPPLLDEITGERDAPPRSAVGVRAERPPEGVLERWTAGSWERHRLDPPPLVDPVTGVLHRIVERPGEPDAPPGFVHLHAELPHLSSVDRTFQPDPLAPAGGFRGAAVPPAHEAILSGVAHECGAYLRQGTLRVATAAELREQGERVLTVTDWRPHDPRLHEAPGFPFVRDHPRLRMAWLRGEDGHGACWAPVSLVHAGYPASGLEHLPLTNGHNLVGLQAGFTEEEALDRAAAHLIAQDAVARWWGTAAALPEAPLPEVARAGWGGSPWIVRVLAVPSRFDVPVRLAMVDDPSDGIIALGYGCAASAEDAATRAIVEALIQHASARDLARPDSLIRNAAALGNGGVAGLAPYDPQRRYAAAFADRRLMTDPMCHLQHGLDPEIADRTRQRLRPAAAAAAKPPPPTTASPYQALSRARTGHVRIDVTTARARAAGTRAIRLLTPGLRRLSVSAFDVHDDRAAAPYPGW